MRWHDVQDEFEKMMNGKRKRCHVHRFQDTMEVQGVKGVGKGFAGNQPADFIVTLDGKTFYAEVKSCENVTSFPFSNITQSQFRAATRVTSAGGIYLFFIKHLDQWYMVEAGIILERWERGVKSMPWGHLSQHKVNLESL